MSQKIPVYISLMHHLEYILMYGKPSLVSLYNPVLTKCQPTGLQADSALINTPVNPKLCFVSMQHNTMHCSEFRLNSSA